MDKAAEGVLIGHIPVAERVAVLAHLHGNLDAVAVAQIDMAPLHVVERAGQVFVTRIAAALVSMEERGVVRGLGYGLLALQEIGVAPVEGVLLHGLVGRALHLSAVFQLDDRR